MSWGIWITGLPGTGTSAIARAAAAGLRALGAPVKVLELDEISQSITPVPRYTDRERELLYRALSFMATLLTGTGVPVIIDATAHRRAWRDLARAAIPRFAEVQLLCPVEVCLERERAARLGLASAVVRPGRDLARAPDIAMDYEESLRPDLTLRTDLHDVWSTVEQALRLVGRLVRAAPTRLHVHDGTGP